MSFRPAPLAAAVAACALLAVPASEAAKPQTGVRFTLTEPDTVDIWVTSPCTGDTVRVVELQYALRAGNHVMFWRGIDRENRRVGDGEPVAALATTDVDGAFAIDTACLPFGYEFDGYDELGAPTGRSMVSHSVRLWAVTPDHAVIAGDWVTIDAEDGADVVIAPAPLP